MLSLQLSTVFAWSWVVVPEIWFMLKAWNYNWNLAFVYFFYWVGDWTSSILIVCLAVCRCGQSWWWNWLYDKWRSMGVCWVTKSRKGKVGKHTPFFPHFAVYMLLISLLNKKNCWFSMTIGIEKFWAVTKQWWYCRHTTHKVMRTSVSAVLLDRFMPWLWVMACYLLVFRYIFVSRRG